MVKHLGKTALNITDDASGYSIKSTVEAMQLQQSSGDWDHSPDGLVNLNCTRTSKQPDRDAVRTIGSSNCCSSNQVQNQGFSAMG